MGVSVIRILLLVSVKTPSQKSQRSMAVGGIFISKFLFTFKDSDTYTYNLT